MTHLLCDNSAIVVYLNFYLIFQVHFVTTVSIAQHPKINDWLTLVEKEMRVTLAKLLAKSVQEVTAFKSGKIDPEQYMQWIDGYQVGIIYRIMNNT